jgi:hypothetical protein
MKLKSLVGIIQFLLKGLPTRDYPVLNSRLFCLLWFAAILDKGVNSLRDLFYQLNPTAGQITVYLSIKGYKKPPSFSRLRIIDSRQVGFNCIP